MTDTDSTGEGRPLPEPAAMLPHRPPFLFVTELVSLIPGQEVDQGEAGKASAGLP